MQNSLLYFESAFDLFSSPFFIIGQSIDVEDSSFACLFYNKAFDYEFIESSVYISPNEISEIVLNNIDYKSIQINRKYNIIVNLKSKFKNGTFYHISIISSQKDVFYITLEPLAKFNDPTWNRLLLNNSAIVYSTKPNGDNTFNFISDNVVNILGYESKEFVIADDFWDSLIKDEYKAYVIDSLKNIELHDELRMIYPIRNHVGEYRWFEERAKLIRKDDGTPLEIIGMVIDVHEQQQSFDNLNKTLEELRTIINTIPGLIMVFDKDLNFLDINEAAKKTLPFLKNSDKIDYKCNSINESNCKQLIDELNFAIEKNVPFSRLTDKNEEKFFGNNYNILISPIKSSNNIVWGAVLVMFDVHEFVSNELKLNELVISLKDARKLELENTAKIISLVEDLEDSQKHLLNTNRQKDVFFSILAHDLRTPLSGFMQLTRILATEINELSKEEVIEMANSMYESSQNLFKLLENLLDWSKIQLGKVNYSPITMQLSTLVMMNIDLMVQVAKHKNIRLINKVPNSILVYTDVNIINTIFRNLISNAMKFSYSDSDIIVNANKIKNNFIEVGIQDCGVGMKKEIIDSLFQFDKHITTKGTNEETGTGLGLVLCKELVEKNGGSIRIESELGKGSCFYFTVPSLGPKLTH